MKVKAYFLVSASILALIAGAVLPARAGKAADPGRLCRLSTLDVERMERLPARLLTAISLAETGRWDGSRRVTFAWPWTVNAEKRGRYFASKAAAIAEVKTLRARGVRNIDVGCMQINLLHHGHAFSSLEEAFDPGFNVAYAARLIKRLRREARSWSRAIGYYHSRTPERSAPYRRKVYRFWRDERRRVAEERRRRRIYERQRNRKRRRARLAR